MITEFSAKSCWMESTAPLMTDESKPKRNPPTAPATDSPIARRPNGPRSVKVPVGSDSELVMPVTLPMRGPPRQGPSSQMYGGPIVPSAS
ncbi:hypothetical protein [Microbacterium elymi]|uniref:Uncharacterized protein n=1 Tax=Microbacterium elymi TaxID=2909587 RepID=A0ABY5NNF9_9MICO|nr:hypothetical protein [Microbacterium elymi]UUT36756.1 hypothetical protein L2X98_20180 [Microbacterium elymi]